jgi:SAM-dependent methyltransferase
MDPARFDRFADEYQALHAQNIEITGESPDYFAEYKIRDICRQITAIRHCKNLRILDFGSGVGNSTPFFEQYFPSSDIVCVDVSARSLDLARRRFEGVASHVLFAGESLPFKSGAFDVAFSACVFHHIASAEHVTLLREIRRVLAKDSGRFFLYEHNPLNPLTLRAVNTCQFDSDAVLIPSWRMRRRFRDAGYSNISIRYRVFFPRYMRLLRFLEPKLWFLPLGAQYCISGKA